MKIRLLLAGLALLAVALLHGCGAPVMPVGMNLAINAGTDQNPDTAGAAAPVKIYIFQLSATGKFEQADVFALTERAPAVLGTEMLAMEDFVLRPGEQRTIARELKTGAQFIGTVVLFLDIDRAKWRGIAKLPGSQLVKTTLTTKGITATLAPF